MELTIRRAFLSTTVRELFCSHYDKSIYEAIKHEPPYRPRNCFENWEAVIAIAKIISDTQNSGEEKNIRNTADFVIECAKEVPKEECQAFLETLKLKNGGI